MNWKYLRPLPLLDTRARFVAKTPQGGSLLDLGTSDGETLGHFAQLRPDLHLHAVDIAGEPQRYPPNTQFQRANLERDTLPWPDRSIDTITSLHLVEHLHDLGLLFCEVARLLKPGGRAYFETPHPKSLTIPTVGGHFPMNFWDDTSHVGIVTTDAMARQVDRVGLQVQKTGISRNWLFAASHLVFVFFPPGRKKYTAKLHWLGWSAYLIARKPL